MCVQGTRALGPQKVVWQWRVTCWTYGQVTPHVLYSLYPLRRILSLGKFDFSSRRALPTIKYSGPAPTPISSQVRSDYFHKFPLPLYRLEEDSSIASWELRIIRRGTHARTRARCTRYRCVSKKGKEWIVVRKRVERSWRMGWIEMLLDLSFFFFFFFFLSPKMVSYW